MATDKVRQFDDNFINYDIYLIYLIIKKQRSCRYTGGKRKQAKLKYIPK